MKRKSKKISKKLAKKSKGGDLVLLRSSTGSAQRSLAAQGMVATPGGHVLLRSSSSSSSRTSTSGSGVSRVRSGCGRTA